MASNHRMTDNVIGMITNVSNENKKKKFFVKFTLITPEYQTIDGWIFSSTSGILSTPLGEAITHSMKTKSGIKLFGNLEQGEDSSTFRMQSFSRFQTVNLNHALESPTNEIIQIRQALSTNDLVTIRCSVLQINPPVDYNDNGLQRSLSFIVIADDSTTTYLMIIDLKPDLVQLENVYEMSKIKKKIINGSMILSTTIDTNIQLSNMPVNPNIENLNDTLNIELNELKTIETCISEVGEIQHTLVCNICSNQLKENSDTSILLFCDKCKKFSLKKNVKETLSTSVVLTHESEKMIVYVDDAMLREMMNVIGINPETNDTDKIISLMSHGNLVFTFNQINRHLIEIKKP